MTTRSGWVPSDVEALRRAFPGDGYVRYAVPPDALVVRSADGWAWVHDWRPTGHPGGAAVLRDGAAELDGTDESAALALLVELAGQRGAAPEWFSTEPGRPLVAPHGWSVGDGGSWQFFWCDTGTARLPEGEGPRLLELDDLADAEEIGEFGVGNNPSFEGFPGRGFATAWVGARDDAGDLAAVGAIHLLATGHAHLAGIVVRTDRRGTGLGRALTTELVRRSLAATGVCTLGVFADNAAAIGLYRSLGFQPSFTFTTRPVRPA